MTEPIDQLLKREFQTALSEAPSLEQQTEAVLAEVRRTEWVRSMVIGATGTAAAIVTLSASMDVFATEFFAELQGLVSGWSVSPTVLGGALLAFGLPWFAWALDGTE